MTARADVSMRLWDLSQRVLAACLLIPGLAVAVVAGFLIRLNSAGPILIRLTREGKDGACFPIYKLRTMVPDAETILRAHLAADDALRREWDEFGRLVRDPRVAGPIARLARRLSIDELPQFLNVIAGQMNLVGPRPLPLEVAATICPEHRKCRQAVLPGITGVWQVSGRSDLSIDEMGRLDSIYVGQRTPIGDLQILLLTIGAVLSGRGAY